MAEETYEIRVARRIFVGNLSYRTSWQDLKDHFSTVGAVRYTDVLREPGPQGRSKGCGIVEFDSPDDAAQAILQLHDSELGGRKIWVREDREDFELRGEGGPPPRRDYGGGGGYRGGHDDRHRSRTRSPLRGGGGGGGYCGGDEAVTVGRRVYVGNLPFETTWQDLKDHMKQAGRVAHADILTDRDGRSRGCGVVEFEHASDALRAISTLSNTTLGGRQIHVREDREEPGQRGPPPPRYDDRDRAPRGGGGGSAAPGTQIVVHGLPYKFSWQDLKDLCRPAGAVVRADIVLDHDGRSKGFGLVAFTTPSDAQAAIEMINSGTELEGRMVSAKLDKYS